MIVLFTMCIGMWRCHINRKMDNLGTTFYNGLMYFRIRYCGYDYLIPCRNPSFIPDYAFCKSAIDAYTIYGSSNVEGIKCFKC